MSPTYPGFWQPLDEPLIFTSTVASMLIPGFFSNFLLTQETKELIIGTHSADTYDGLAH